MAVGDLKKKAREALKRKQYQLAIEISQEYLGLKADDEEAMDTFFVAATKLRETRGKSLFGGMLSKMSAGTSRDPKKRIASCLRALAKNPDDKGTLMALGAACLDANAFGSGVVAYKRAASVDEDDAEPWKRLGEALGKRGRIKEALDALSEAIRIEPRDQEANKMRKNMAAEGALKISGFETAKSSRDLIKDKEVAQQLESEVRLQLTPEHAASELDKVLEEVAANPGDPRLHVRAADLYLQQKDEAKALEMLDKALALDPGNYDLSVRAGDLRLRPLTARVREAQAALRKNPDDPTLRQAYEAAAGPLIEASLEEYGRRVKEHPLDLGERFKLGQWLFQAGRIDEALAEFQQTVRDPNRKTQSLRFQAKCFERKNILNLAVRKLEEATETFPTMNSDKAKDLFYDYADLLARSGNEAKAREVFERIVEEDASFKDALTRLSQLASDSSSTTSQ